MMTALLFLESGKDMNAEITIPASLTQEFKDIQNANGSTINLRIGETVRRIDLLYGLLVASANDAASVIASDVSDGDLTAFVARMNQRAKELGCTSTSFTCVHGLYDYGNVSSAHDLALIAKACAENEIYMQVANTLSYTLPATNLHQNERTITSTNLMLNPEYANFRVAIDCVNSVGGIILPELLHRLGVQHVEKLYCEPTGNFQHNPEPLEKNLGDIMNLMKGGKADVAFVVDPDVDRLAMICEDGTMYGEEYTLVTVADYVLKHTPGNTVSNLSSTRALRDVTRKYGMQYNAAAVGEVNVVTKMKETNAVIGGEGNGGVIYPESHYGRDALVGIALFLSHLAHEGKKVSELRASYPNYYIAKNRIDLTPQTDVDAILAKVKDLYKAEEINDIDGA